MDSDRKVNRNIYQDAVTRDRMRLIDHMSGQLEPIHHCLVEELQEIYKLFLFTQEKKLSVCQNNVAAFSCSCKIYDNSNEDKKYFVSEAYMLCCVILKCQHKYPLFILTVLEYADSLSICVSLL